ncbi:SRPBCC family protein [Albirhodobacter sp. R86504]|uniref:SRPBCC family protein n=1 Tax=Albirhodobacter sp. R86504 TaxID=3093848 RepID=UPI00366C01EB
MQFSSQQDILAPIERAFDILSDFNQIETIARGRKIDVKRLDNLTQAGVGLSWDISFKMRGKRRELIVDLVEFTRPDTLAFSGVSSSFEIEANVVLTEVTPMKTRMKIVTSIAPRSLGARLMIQSAKLGKTSLNKKYDKRIKAFADAITAFAARS